MTDKSTEAHLLRLEERLIINPDALDEELVSHPNDYYHVCQGHDLAVSLRDQKKEDIANLEASLSLLIRKTFAERKEKLTEDYIKAMIQKDFNHIDEIQLYLQLKYLADRWKSLRDSFEKKGSALDGLIKLFQKNYFAEHAVPMEERNKSVERITKNIQE
jgi:hypothetical protein